jgi:hypothetical protein
MQNRDKVIAAGLGVAAGAAATKLLTPVPVSASPVDLTGIQKDIAELKSNIQTLLDRRTPMAGEIQHMPYQYLLTPAGTPTSGVRMSDKPEWDCTLRSIQVNFPAGCLNLVNVTVYHNRTQILPRNGVLALDDAFPEYFFTTELNQTDDIVIEMDNGDAVNSHQITIIVNVQKKES